MTIIGIGCGASIEGILKSAETVASADNIVRCYCCPKVIRGIKSPSPYVELSVNRNPCFQMIDDLIDKKIDGAVRGTLPANYTLKRLKVVCEIEKMERIALLETVDHKRFFLAPVGIDEGWSIDEKISLILGAQEIARKLGVSDKVAVLSGGRKGDIGRHKIVDQTIHDAEMIAKLTEATNSEIMIENAILENGIIIAPDGISGNLIFRTLMFLGHGIGHGAPIINIPFIFIDSSRASKSFAEPLSLAMRLAKQK